MRKGKVADLVARNVAQLLITENISVRVAGQLCGGEWVVQDIIYRRADWYSLYRLALVLNVSLDWFFAYHDDLVYTGPPPYVDTQGLVYPQMPRWTRAPASLKHQKYRPAFRRARERSSPNISKLARKK